MLTARLMLRAGVPLLALLAVSALGLALHGGLGTAAGLASAAAWSMTVLAYATAWLTLVLWVKTWEKHMAALTEHAKVQAVKHIARRTDEMARTSLDAQSRAMADAAQALFRTEVGPTLQRVVVPQAPGGPRSPRCTALGATADACGDGGRGICLDLGAGGLWLRAR